MVMAIGERPGWDENQRGIPFVGKSGQELNENYLWRAGLDREDIRVTNVVKCWAEGNRKPGEREVRECGGFHLPGEIDECNPAVVILLGATACSLIPGLDLEIEHGIPRHAQIFGWEGVVVPMYHPAAGLHDTGKMIPLLEDFERLGKALRGEWAQPTDPYPKTDYQLITNAGMLCDYLDLGSCELLHNRFIAIDTERHDETAFSYQISVKPGTGRMVLCGDKPVARQAAGLVNGWLAETEAEVVLHYAGQDLDWLDRMGVRVAKFRDTLQEAYHQGTLPQGLKALAYRLFGIRMQTYGDVVTPYSLWALEQWILEAIGYAEDNLAYITEKQLKTKLKRIVKPGILERRLRGIFMHTMAPTYDPWQALAEAFDRADLSPAEKEFADSVRKPDIAQKVMAKLVGSPGPVPTVGIGNVPLEEAVRYGCADADITLRVALELERRREQLTGIPGQVMERLTSDGSSWVVAEGDEDQ
jgi:DNA polymerase